MNVRGLIRSRWLRVIGAAVAALLLYLAFAIFGVQTLFYDEEVNEDFAVSLPTEDQLPSEAGNPATSEDAVGSDPVPVRVSSGEFHAVAHPGTGDAHVYRLKDGARALRLENLDIVNGAALDGY